MTECEDTSAAWGSICPSCGVRLPNPKPITSWMAERHITSEKMRKAALKNDYLRKWRDEGLYARRKRAA